jgi:hypothetical protein
MEAARTSETLVNFYQTTWRYNPEDSHRLPQHLSIKNTYEKYVDKCKEKNLALKSATTECELKDMQRAKMEESLGTATSDSPVCHEFYTSLLHTGQSQTATASVDGGRG